MEVDAQEGKSASRNISALVIANVYIYSRHSQLGFSSSEQSLYLYVNLVKMRLYLYEYCIPAVELMYI